MGSAILCDLVFWPFTALALHRVFTQLIVHYKKHNCAAIRNQYHRVLEYASLSWDLTDLSVLPPRLSKITSHMLDTKGRVTIVATGISSSSWWLLFMAVSACMKISDLRAIQYRITVA